jgi:hypothetical protein
MATPIDGPDLSVNLSTWACKFGYATWTKWVDSSQAQATTVEKTLLFTGGGNYSFGFNGGLDNQSFIEFGPANGINSDYVPEFVGETFYPGGQGQPPETIGSYTAYPAPPQTMTEDLFTTGVQNVDNSVPTNSTFWFYNVDAVDGLTDQT